MLQASSKGRTQWHISKRWGKASVGILLPLVVPQGFYDWYSPTNGYPTVFLSKERELSHTSKIWGKALMGNLLPPLVLVGLLLLPLTHGGLYGWYSPNCSPTVILYKVRESSSFLQAWCNVKISSPSLQVSSFHKQSMASILIVQELHGNSPSMGWHSSIISHTSSMLHKLSIN